MKVKLPAVAEKQFRSIGGWGFHYKHTVCVFLTHNSFLGKSVLVGGSKKARESLRVRCVDRHNPSANFILMHEIFCAKQKHADLKALGQTLDNSFGRNE